jgi:hypothetical protein
LPVRLQRPGNVALGRSYPRLRTQSRISATVVGPAIPHAGELRQRQLIRDQPGIWHFSQVYADLLMQRRAKDL